MTMRLTAVLMLAFLSAAPLAAAQDQPEIDAIVASEMEPGEPADTVWDQTMADLERDYPAVARAVKQPNFVQEVSDEEESSTQAFFAQMNSRNATALRVAGELYSVGITIGQSNLPPAGDGDSSSQGGKGAPALGLGILAVALAAIAIASRKT